LSYTPVARRYNVPPQATASPQSCRIGGARGVAVVGRRFRGAGGNVTTSFGSWRLAAISPTNRLIRTKIVDQSRILVTTPEPTVRPPSRIAKRTPSSIAIGLPNSTVTFTLSPGMHISAPTKFAEPVTSVVRK